MTDRINSIILDAGTGTVAAGAVQVAHNMDPNTTAILAGIFAPIIKEAIFRLIDKIGTMRKNKKARKNGTD